MTYKGQLRALIRNSSPMASWDVHNLDGSSRSSRVLFAYCLLYAFWAYYSAGVLFFAYYIIFGTEQEFSN